MLYTPASVRRDIDWSLSFGESIRFSVYLSSILAYRVHPSSCVATIAAIVRVQ
jgi:hypothetical protein